MFDVFLKPAPTRPTPIKAGGSWGEATHRWAQPELDALAAAGYSGRALLVKGEPGVGKSQLARAAAAMLGWRFEYEVVSPRLEPQDLLWRFDPVRKLAAAHAGRDLGDEAFVTPGLLWRALDPVSAAAMGPQLSQPALVDTRPCVVLLDEIDKADSDLPNSLLEVLGNRAFKSPWGTVPRQGSAAASGPLVVVTSNNERELPLAFMRRCVVLEMVVPDEQAADGRFERWLVERGKAQFAALGGKVLAQAARMVRDDRIASPVGLGARPGLAEYLDLLRALNEIGGGKRRRGTLAPAELLKRLGRYVLRKQDQPAMPQGPGREAPGS